MLTTRIRRTAVTLLAVALVALAATAPAGAATRATTTGDQNLDAYCKGTAALVNHAIQEGNAAQANGDADGATEWFALAEYMVRDAIDHGCHFVKARHAGPAGTHPKPSRLIASGRIKADPSGDSELDRYCDDIASDVNAALDKEKAQRDAGNDAAADSWHEYANRLLKTARSRGCGFVKARRVQNDTGRPDVDTSKQTTSDPSPSQTDKTPQTGPGGDPQVHP